MSVSELSAAETPVPETNWAGNHTFQAPQIAHPATVEDVQTLVRQSEKVKALGARHSFNDIADSTQTIIALDRLPETLAIDEAGQRAQVSSQFTYARLCSQLHTAEYAIHNMASLPHISLAGAIATATHGSGDTNGNLATAVGGLDMITADGARVQFVRPAEGRAQDDEFSGAVVSLGALGVVVGITLDVRPTFQVQQAVYERLPFAHLLENFDGVMGGAYSVSLFTDWQTDRVNQVWLKQLAGEDVSPFAPDFHGAQLSAVTLHPSGRTPADSCTEQMGVPGPWHERLPHFRPEHTPSVGHELQSEYFVPRAQAVDALRTVAELGSVLAGTLIISEVRTIAEDALWLSPAYGQDCVGIHFTWRNDWPAVQAVLPTVEEALLPFAPRPHWGKIFTYSAAHLQAVYPRLADFRALMQKYDPQGKFRNRYLEQSLLG
jgi:alditol oxidase